MNEYPDRLRDLLDFCSRIEERSERVQFLIEMAKRYEPVPERIATRPYAKEHQAPGCESEVYVWGEELGDRTLRFHFAVENPHSISARALAAILQETLSGEPLDRVAAVRPDVVFTIFGSELSMGKSLGLSGVVHMVAALARRHAAITQ